MAWDEHPKKKSEPGLKDSPISAPALIKKAQNAARPAIKAHFRPLYFVLCSASAALPPKASSDSYHHLLLAFTQRPPPQ